MIGRELAWLVGVAACVAACGDDSSGASESTGEADGSGSATVGTSATTPGSSTNDGSGSTTGGTMGSTGSDTADEPPVCDTPEGSPLALRWAATRDGGGTEDGAGALATDVTGNAYLAWTAGIDGLDGVSALTAFAPDGAVLWEVTPFAPASTDVNAIAVAPDGTIYAVGSTFVQDPMYGLTTAPFVGAWSSAGEPLWTDATSTHPPNPFTQPNSLAVAPDGTVLVSGLAGNADGFFRRYAAGGTIAWTVVDGTTPNAIAVDPTGDFFVAGSAADTPDAVIERRDPAGAVMWSAAGPGPGSTDYDSGSALRVAVGSDGNVVVAGLDGYLIGNPMMPTDSWSIRWLREFSADGGAVWTTTEPHEDYMQMALVVVDGSATLAHRRMDGRTHVARYDPAGMAQWSLDLPCPHEGIAMAAVEGDLWFGGRIDDVGGQNAFVGRYGP